MTFSVWLGMGMFHIVGWSLYHRSHNEFFTYADKKENTPSQKEKKRKCKFKKKNSHRKREGYYMVLSLFLWFCPFISTYLHGKCILDASF